MVCYPNAERTVLGHRSKAQAFDRRIDEINTTEQPHRKPTQRGKFASCGVLRANTGIRSARAKEVKSGGFEREFPNTASPDFVAGISNGVISRLCESQRTAKAERLRGFSVF